jgi:hypothetical protein
LCGNLLRCPESFCAWDSTRWDKKKATMMTTPEPERPAAPPIDQHAQAKRFYDLLGGGIREIRGIGAKGLLVGYFANADDFAHAVREVCNKGYNAYTNLNPFDPLDARFQPAPLHRSKEACADADITRITRLLTDVDPERNHPKGGKICSTDAEHEAALAKIAVIKSFLVEQGCPPNALIENDSGNGGALVLPIDLPNVPDSINLIRRFLQALAQKFDDAGCHVDTSVGNPSRITRVPGGRNNKLSTKERPNRLCHTLSAPDTLETVSVDFLNKIAGTAIAPVEQESDPEIEFAAIPEGDRKEQIEMLLAYLVDAGIKATGFGRNEAKHRTCINLPYCLIKGAEHQTPGRAGILVYDDGRIGYHCFSAQCAEKGWGAVQATLGSFAVFCARHFDKTDRLFDDPLRLAQKHIAKTAMRDGTATFAHFQNGTFRYTKDEWQELATGEEDAWVRDTIQREHDDLATFLTKQAGEAIKPDPVSSGHVRETMAALQSLCKHRVSKTTQPPFWLSSHDNWQATDVLVFTNGFFNLRHWLEGKECFIPKTPKLFYQYQAAFDYVEKPESPVVWHAFLDSLDQADDWRLQLQQMMGYLLWLGSDLQKFFPMFGPTRAGKGIIEQVAADMGGGACSITLDGFCDSFGLEKAIGKRLILVGETEKGPTKFPESAVVRAIKAITGGGEVEVNRKHIKNISLHLPGKILMNGNSPFVLTDNSGALMARCIPFRLTKSFLGQEDTALPSKLKSEYPGIFVWCLEGLRSLYAAGRFTLCKSTLSELEQTRDLATPLQTFIEDYCTVDTVKAVHCKALFTIFEQWLASEDAPLTWNDKQFGTELRTAIPAIDRKRLSNQNDTSCNGCTIIKTDFDSDSFRPWVYTGIAPKPDRCRFTYNY